MKNPFIEFRQVNYRYPEQNKETTDVLQAVDFSIDSGEYVAIVGANGSGKTTLVKIIDGLLLPSKGRVAVGGIDLTSESKIKDIRRKVAMVFQSPEDQIVATTVEEDIAFGLENYGVPTREMHARVRKVMEGFDLWEIRSRPSYMLSGGQTQRLALASALAIQPECIIFDESTSMLDPAARKNLLGVMKSFHGEGKTILHITHSMDEASQADRILVMNKGSLVFDGTPKELFTRENIATEWNLEYPEAVEFVRHLHEHGIPVPEQIVTIPELAGFIFDRCKIDPDNIQFEQTFLSDDLVVQVEDLTFDYLKNTPYSVRALGGVSFSVREASGHGLIGKTGSGKSTILQHLNGILRPQEGTIHVGDYLLNDENITIKDLVRYAGLVMQNPENQFFEFYVGDEIAFGPKNIGFEGKLSDRVQMAMEMVGLDFLTFKDRPVHTLSGGEKRKAALASILALNPRLLLLDEPTAGLDPKSRRDVLESFHKLKTNRMTIVVSSHNLGDILSLTETITLLENGISVLNENTKLVLSNPDILLNHGIDPPYLTKVTSELSRRTGIDFSGICSFEQFIKLLEIKEHVLN